MLLGSKMIYSTEHASLGFRVSKGIYRVNDFCLLCIIKYLEIVFLD